MLRWSSSSRFSAALLAESRRAMSSYSTSKLFVGGLSFAVDDAALKAAFEQYGEVKEAWVVRDRELGRSKGIAFVNYASKEEARAARDGMDGKELNGRKIRVDFSSDRALGGRIRSFAEFGS